MDIKELKVEQIKAEAAIGEAVQKVLQEFHSKTGASIESVSIYLVELQTMNKEVDEFIVSSVSCRIAF